MKILCTICVRSGSKGIYNKNIKKINGKHLVQYTIEQAFKTKIFDYVVVSTDSKKISNIAKKSGAHSWFLRPKYLSNDNSPKLTAIKHAFVKSEKYFNQKFDILVDLDATSPLRNIGDIKKSIQKLKEKKSDNLITLCDARKNPYFNMVEFKNGIMKKVKSFKNKKIYRRQDAPKVYEMNASIYIWTRKAILNNLPIIAKKTSYHIMPYSRSIDIDSESDFEYVKYLIKKNG